MTERNLAENEKLETMNGPRKQINIRLYPWIVAMLKAEAKARKHYGSEWQLVEAFILENCTSLEASMILAEYGDTNPVVTAVARAKARIAKTKPKSTES